jgi:hypothetical protein
MHVRLNGHSDRRSDSRAARFKVAIHQIGTAANRITSQPGCPCRLFLTFEQFLTHEGTRSNMQIAQPIPMISEPVK